MTRHTRDPENRGVQLRDVVESDLPIFFEQQLDPEANYMAAFTARDPTDRNAFMAHWVRILDDETNTIKTILFNGQVAGSVASYIDEEFGKLEVTYWIGKQYWGKGVATRALSTFLDHVPVRPLYGRAAKDNIASLRVMEKCGFTICGEGKGFAYARGNEVEEFILRLESSEAKDITDVGK
jgi:RimJ/RimL family protein N-acetyltransferase